MDWISVLKDLWWLFFGLLGGLIASVWRLAIKTNKVLEQVERVKSHDTEIKSIKKDIETLGEGVHELKGSLDAHVIDQKGDIKAINRGLLAIMEQLIHPRESKQKLEDARDELLDRLNEK